MTKKDKVLLAQRVKDFRMDRQWYQEQAAAYFKVSIATYVRVEHGKGCSDLIRARFEKMLIGQQQEAVA
jgi:DNA-binding XRE family transcriptional regulator